MSSNGGRNGRFRAIPVRTGAAVADRLSWPLSHWSRRRFARAGIRLEPEVSFQGGDGYLFFGTPEVTFAKFFGGTKWSPGIGQFGIWPLVTSTLVTSAIAMLVSLPLGLSAALYLAEYASPRARATLKPVLEILAGIPTVVYGYFALLFMTPLLQNA